VSSTFAKLTTADELLAMPDDGFRYELIEGELIRMSPAGSTHGQIAVMIAANLFTFVKANGLGAVYAAETGFKLKSDPDTVRAPDVAFVSKSRVDAVAPTHGFWPGPPDFAVEVLSFNDSRRKTDTKAKHWIASGARLVWLVDPKRRTVTVYRSLTDIHEYSESETVNGYDVVPGFTLEVKEIFSEL
jgi:Uma2 family endonuclease